MGRIESIIDSAITDNVFGDDFKFRKHQREVVENICHAYLKDSNATIVLDAPTGSGKSLIAMWSSYVLTELGKTGYMVTSDLMLQDQYSSDLNRLGIKWPSIKGVDNYECTVNGLKFSLADCKLRGMGYEEAQKLDCYQSCDYLQLRNKAINAPVAVLNYAYWLIQRNYVEDRSIERGTQAPFGERDFTFFDEAHKVDDIVQNHFSPRIGTYFLDKLNYINRFFERENINDVTLVSKNVVTEVIYTLMHESDKGLLFEAIKEFKSIAQHYRNAQGKFKISVRRRFKGKIPSNWTSAATSLDFMKDVYCKFDDYVDIIEDSGIQSMVVDQRPDEVKFMCIKEAQLIKNHLHTKAGFKVFMSATIGDPKLFIDVMGIENAKFIRIDNEFNYDRSPVVFVNRHKLTYKTKEENLPKVLKILDQIINKHKGQRGIIHSGSYQFTNYIKNESSNKSRIMNYVDSKQKKEVIRSFKKRDDGILIGPSLLEGLDLKDDISRFQIFFKVPYPSLADPLIKAKLENSSSWYDWKTLNNIQQGIGRSIRSDSDWAVTYIIDASFTKLMPLFKQDPRMLERIKTIQ